MTQSKAHQHSAFASLLLAIATAATAFYVPTLIAVQNSIAAALLAVCAFGHVTVQPWAYRLTQGVSLLVLLGGFAALLTTGQFGLGVLPNIVLLWLIFTNQQTRKDWDSTPPDDSRVDS